MRADLSFFDVKRIPFLKLEVIFHLHVATVTGVKCWQRTKGRGPGGQGEWSSVVRDELADSEAGRYVGGEAVGDASMNL